jgi:nondiscriminating aspartyl-tRNA synthetase
MFFPPFSIDSLVAIAKKAAEKAAKEQEKQRKAEQLASEQAAKSASELAAVAHLVGVSVLLQSRATDRTGRRFLRIDEIHGPVAGSSLVRARVHSVRAAGNLVFVTLRQAGCTLQAVMSKSDAVPKAALKFVAGVTLESIVDVCGTLVPPEKAIEGATCTAAELQIATFFVVSAAAPLPFQLADAMTPEPELAAYEAKCKAAAAALEAAVARGAAADEIAALEKAKEAAEGECRPVARVTSLDHRALDLRTPANLAIFRVQAAVCRLFREHLTKHRFVEIQSPKLIGCLSEGGANVFEVAYFGKKAYLAQSPQFYKQMCITADFERVFEVAPVYRAENSNTPRHMTEFIGLDLEMAFNEHYHEVLDMIDSVFQHIFEGLFREHKHDLQIVAQQYPVEPLKFKFPSPLLTFADAVAMLRADGVAQDLYEDLSTENEKRLGKLVRDKFDTDYYRLDKFPESARPFYTMPDPDDPKLTNSYDFFMRGQEVLSGAQRVHDMKLLIERARAKNVDIATIEGYTSSFKYGAPPHAGCGLGLNRVTFLFLGLTHITQSTLFPRLTNRLYP